MGGRGYQWEGLIVSSLGNGETRRSTLRKSGKKGDIGAKERGDLVVSVKRQMVRRIGTPRGHEMRARQCQDLLGNRFDSLVLSAAL